MLNPIKQLKILDKATKEAFEEIKKKEIKSIVIILKNFTIGLI